MQQLGFAVKVGAWGYVTAHYTKCVHAGAILSCLETPSFSLTVRQPAHRLSTATLMGCCHPVPHVKQPGSQHAPLLQRVTLGPSLLACVHGRCLQDVRMSPDNLKAFILWDSFTGQAGSLERELQKQ